MIGIFLVDDHELVRTGIRRILEDQNDYVILGEASSGEEAMDLLRNLDSPPQIVMMDLNMPGVGGLETTRNILKRYPEIKVIIVSMIDEGIIPGRVLKAGAMGYITKGASSAEMSRGIREVIAGRRYVSPDIAQKMLSDSIAGEQSPFEELSERELQVMLMLMDGTRVSDISEKLFISPKTVSTYRYRIYEKLGINSDMELMKMAMQHGIMTDTRL
ncbi:MAG: response regulator [Gammaproteobacteria bacterium]